jgi:hypothetical protein
MLAALDRRKTRPGLSHPERAGIDSARSAILKRFPALRPEENRDAALEVRSLWLAAEHAQGAPVGRGGFLPDATVWWEGRLWVFDLQPGRLWQIDPKSGASRVHAPENAPRGGPPAQLVSWGRRLAVATESGVWVLDEGLKRWEKLDLPPSRYFLGVVRGELWAASREALRLAGEDKASGNALYRILPDLKNELVVSSRRRPAVHPLDDTLTGAPFSLCASRNGGVLLGTRGLGEIFKFFDSGLEGEKDREKKRINQRFIGGVKATSSPGLIMRHKHPGVDRNRDARLELFDAEKEEFLLSYLEFGRSEPARYAYPSKLAELPASRYSAAWREGGVEILGWSRIGSQWGATEAWLVRIEAGGSSVVPLRFEWPAGSDERARLAGSGPEVFRNPRIADNGLIATEQGLVIMGGGINGFWFIPKEDLDARPQVMPEADAK